MTNIVTEYISETVKHMGRRMAFGIFWKIIDEYDALNWKWIVDEHKLHIS